MPLQSAPYSISVSNSYIGIAIEPPMVEERWSEIERFGGEIIKEVDQRDHPACLIDLSSLEYMGSSLVALIVRVWKEVNDQDGKMAVVVVHPTVRETITLAGLDKIWKIYDNAPAAMEALNIPKSEIRKLQGGDDQGKSFFTPAVYIGMIIAIVAISCICYFVLQRIR